MKTLSKILIGLAVVTLCVSAASAPVSALTITNGNFEFHSLPEAPSGSGLGNYNVILFANASGGSSNAAGAVNVDNSNTNLPTGGQSGSGTLFWLTTAGELQAFYTQQFPTTPINNIVLFLDINEGGSGTGSVTVTDLKIYKNATTTPSLDASGDLSSAQQGSITSGSGTLLKQLSNIGPSLDQLHQGNGVDDWAIFTFINPFALLPTDTLLFRLELNDLASGGEVLAISGTVSACDVIDPTTCPTTSGTTTGTTTGTTGTTTTGTTTGTTTTGTTTGTTTTTTTGTTTSGEPTTGGTTDPTTGSSTTTTGETTSSSTSGTASTGTSTTGVTTFNTTSDSTGSTTRDIPEPSSFLLLGAGLVALSRVTKRKRD